jgi:nicotinate dehydrogenase subunit B
MPEPISRRDVLQAVGAGAFLFAGTPIRIQPAASGTYTLFTGKVELGQGARTELTQAVAEELRVPVDRIQLVMGDTALCPDDGGTYASLTTPLNLPEIRKETAAHRGGTPTPSAEWKVLGTPVHNVRGREIVTGAQPYASDLHVEDMLYASIVRAPYYRATLDSIDAPKDARIIHDRDLVAALASDPVTAARLARSIKPRWKPEPFLADPSDDDRLAAWFKAHSTPPVEQPNARYPPLTRRGYAAKALAAAEQKRTAHFWMPYLAHVPMEPRAAIAIWKDGAVEIHTGTQTPFPVRTEVAKALDIPESHVRIVGTGPGGGFGGKHRAEVEIEAARLARIAGKPVKVAWTREDEFTCAYHRPAGVVEIESAMDHDGKICAWVHRNYNSGPSGLPTPYDMPNHSCEFHRTPAPVRQGPYRSLAAVANIWARESVMDDWAHALHIDPWDFRMRHITDDRLRAVLQKLGKGPGGLACTIEKDARIAMRADVAIEAGAIRLKRFTYVGDYGAIVNPLNLRNQITGALIMGIGGALFEHVRFDAQSQLTRSLADYRVPRFSDIPEIEIHLIDHREIPSAGAGESAITMTAPAIANALHALTGKRANRLPL